MGKKRIAILLAVLLILTTLPGLALGVQDVQVSLKLSQDSAAVGDSITASGIADPDKWVTIKTVDSMGSIVVFDAVKPDANGNYSCTFKVPQVAPGILTVVAGYGSNVANQSLNIVTSGSKSKSKSSSSGGSSISTTDQIAGSKGSSIKEAGAEVNFPADAVSSDIKVTIKKLSSGIPSVPSGLNLLGGVYEISSSSNNSFKKPVTITLPFNPDEVDNNKHDVGIYCWNNNQWVILDEVKVDLKAGKVSGETNHFSKFAVLTSTKDTPIDKDDEPTKDVIPPVKTKLKDISGHWAETSINQLVNVGAISGYPDGTFKPNSSITRAEFATVLVKVLNLEARSGKVFNDTSGHWAQDAISTAAAHGIVSGYDAINFGPDNLITREQMAVMISKAANLSGGEGKTFADNHQIADWAKAAVATTSGKNIISGYPDNTFRPQANATRAEAVTVIVKTLN